MKITLYALRWEDGSYMGKGGYRGGRLDGSGLSDVYLSTKHHNAKAKKIRGTKIVRLVCEVMEEVEEEEEIGKTQEPAKDFIKQSKVTITV